MSGYGLNPQYMGQANASMIVTEASSRLARQQQQQSANQSLPIKPSSSSSSSVDFTNAKYLFPLSKDNTPFLVRIPKHPPISLGDIKRHLPIKGFFRFYFKTEVDGEEVFQEETEEHITVPLWQGNVVVKCSEIGQML